MLFRPSSMQGQKSDIFVGFYEKLPCDRFPKPYIYLHYMDATLACFSSRNEAKSFFHCLNYLHPSLTFAVDEEKDNKLPFLDVLVEHLLFAFVIFIYRKPTFTGLYLSWDAIAPKSRKVNLIKCLPFRALDICSDNSMKTNRDRLKIYFGVMGILTKLLLTPLTKPFINPKHSLDLLGEFPCLT